MPFVKDTNARTRNRTLWSSKTSSEENSTQPSVEQRLRRAVEAASRRLSQEAQAKSKPNISDGNHEVALVKEKNERILTPSQTKAYDAKHPGARKQQKNLDSKAYGLPRVRGLYDESGLVDAPYNPHTDAISDTQQAADFKALQPTTMDKVGSALGKIGRGASSMPGQDNTTYDVSHPASQLQWGALGKLPSYDDGGLTPEQDTQSNYDSPERMRNPDGSLVSSTSAQLSPERQAIDDRKMAAADKGAAGLQELALANIHERELDKHEARTQGSGKPSPMATVEAPKQSGSTDDSFNVSSVPKPMSQPITPRSEFPIQNGNKVVSDPAHAGYPAQHEPEPTAPDMSGQIQPESPIGALGRIGSPDMPRYIGDKRIGKDTPGEVQLTNDYQTQVDHLKSVVTNGTREEAANAQEQLSRLQAGNPLGSAANKAGFGGKLEHVLGRIANIGGNLVGAPEMSLIPGTDLNRAAKRASALGEMKSIGAERLQDAEAAEKLAAAQGKADPKDWQQVTGGAIDPQHPELGVQTAFYDKTNNQLSYRGPAAPKEGTNDKPLGAEGVTNSNQGFTDRYQVMNPGKPLPKQYVLPPNATKADFERVDKQMEQVERAQGTKAQQEQTRQMQRDARADTDRRFEEGRSQKLINYRDKNGDLVSGTREEAQANGIASKDIHGETTPALQQKSREAYTQYSRLMDNAETAMSTLPAWNNKSDRKQAMEVSKMYWDHATFGVPGLASGGISPEYKQQMINSDAYRRMSPQGQEHMQNMFQLWSDAINLAKLETGSSRAVQSVIEREERIMPSADKTPEQNIKALEDLTHRLNKDSKEYARPSDVEPLKQGLIPYNATHEMQDKSGKVVGYVDAKGKDHLFSNK